MNKNNLRLWTTIAAIFTGVNVSVDSFIYLVEYGNWMQSGEMLVLVFSLICGIAVTIAAGMFLNQKYQTKAIAITLVCTLGGLALLLFIGICIGMFAVVFKMFLVTLALIALMVWYLNFEKLGKKKKQ